MGRTLFLIGGFVLAGCGAKSRRDVHIDDALVGDDQDGDGDGDDHDAGSDADGDSDGDTDGDTDVDTDVDVDVDSDADTDAGSECDLFDPEACGEREKCGIRYVTDAFPELASGCVVDGGRLQDERCSVAARPGYDGAWDNCATGLTCLELEGDGLRRCHPLCPCVYPGCDSSGCAELEYCAHLDWEDAPEFPAGVCVPTTPCDPLTQTGCPAKEDACYLPGWDVKLPDCAPWFEDGEGVQGSPCVWESGCAPGYTCDEKSDPFECRRICDPAGGAPTCEEGEGECVELEELVGVGMCPG